MVKGLDLIDEIKPGAVLEDHSNDDDSAIVTILDAGHPAKAHRKHQHA